MKLVNDGVTDKGKGSSDGAAKLHPDSAQPFHVFIQPYYQAKGIGGQAKRNKDTAFKDFQAVVGDKLIREICRNDIIAFHDAMRLKAGRHGSQTNYKTVNKKLSDLRVSFQWCLDQRNVIADNPVRGYSSDATKQEIREGKKPKRSFTAAELHAIFHSPLFSGCASANRVHEPGNVKCRDHRFWFPVIALFTGLRLSELAELEFTDVIQLHDRAVFVKGVVRQVHAASLVLRAPVSRSGFSQTGPTGAQLRGCPDHRSGLAARAFVQRQARAASTV